jgi:hypothetical protein
MDTCVKLTKQAYIYLLRKGKGTLGSQTFIYIIGWRYNPSLRLLRTSYQPINNLWSPPHPCPEPHS